MTALATGSPKDIVPALARSRALAPYLALLAGHVAHVFEEVWGGFPALRLLGLPAFLAVNWALFLAPLALLFFWLRGRRWARAASMAYAVLMILNGLGHVVQVLVAGRYLGHAGAGTAAILVPAGAALFLALRRENR